MDLVEWGRNLKKKRLSKQQSDIIMQGFKVKP